MNRLPKSTIFLKNKKLLILKRRDDETLLPSVWEVPGGGLEKNESIDDGIIRETKEEAGLDITPQKLFGYFEYRDGQGNMTVNLNFLCSTKDAKQLVDVTQGEMQAAKWVNLAELDDYPFTSLTMKEACKQALSM